MGNKDPLGEIILNEEQTKYFNLGKKQGITEEKRKNKPVKPKLTFDEQSALNSIEGRNRTIKRLMKELDYWKKRDERSDKREVKLIQKNQDLKESLRTVEDLYKKLKSTKPSSLTGENKNGKNKTN